MVLLNHAQKYSARRDKCTLFTVWWKKRIWTDGQGQKLFHSFTLCFLTRLRQHIVNCSKNWLIFGSPTTIIVDFEIAVIKNIRAAFPTAKIRGCFFHLKQNVFRKAQELGFQARYENDKEFAANIKLFAALAFLPPKQVNTRFRHVMKIIPKELKPLAEYFELTYVGTATRNPMFPIKFWNVHDRVKDGIPKTSNFAEGFHNKFHKYLKIHRPPIWRFMLTLLQIQQKTENSIRKLTQPGGLPRLQRRKYRHLNEKIVELCSNFNSECKFRAFKMWMFRLCMCLPGRK